MKRILCGLALVFMFSLTGHSQPRRPVLFAAKPAPVDGVVVVPGTKVEIDPPTNYYVSSKFAGFQNGSSIIEVFDLPGGDYSKMKQDFSEATLKKNGVSVLQENEIDVDGYSGLLLKLQKDPEQKSITLIFGDRSLCVIIVASYPVNDDNLESQIVQSLRSVKYDAGRGIDAFATATFNLDDAKTAFRFHKKSANTFYYSMPESASDQDTYMTVTQLNWDYATKPSTIAALMLEQMKKFGIADARARKERSHPVNGYDAFESEMLAIRNGERCMIYQMVMIKDDRALVVHGIGKEDSKRNRDSFRKFAREIRFK